MADDWQYKSITQNLDCVRTGWPGAWDAFLDALLRRPRTTFARPVTFSIFVKGEAQLRMVQLEEHHDAP